MSQCLSEVVEAVQVLQVVVQVVRSVVQYLGSLGRQVGATVGSGKGKRQGQPLARDSLGLTFGWTGWENGRRECVRVCSPRPSRTSK